MSAQGQRTRARLLIVLATALAPLLLWALVVVVYGARITVPMHGAAERQALGFVPMLVTAVGVSFGAWGLGAALERFSAHGLRIWTAIGVAAVLVTLPYLPGFSVGERVFLVAVRIVMFAILVPGMWRTRAVERISARSAS